MTGFVIVVIVGLIFIGMGIYCLCSRRAESKPCGFWANSEMFPVKDVKAYNRAMGKMWCAYGSVLILLGLPVLDGPNSPFLLLSVVGVMFETIVMMAVYMCVIERKYRKK